MKTTTKGSGLSGYVQRSRAGGAVRSANAHIFGPMGGVAAADTSAEASLTPLERMRTTAENTNLAQRLEEHRKQRALELRVLEYGENLTAAGEKPEEQIASEVAELRKTLLTEYKEDLKKMIEKRQAAARAGGAQTSSSGVGGKKTAKDFAAAFKVNTEGREAGDAFEKERRSLQKIARLEARVHAAHKKESL